MFLPEVSIAQTVGEAASTAFLILHACIGFAGMISVCMFVAGLIIYGVRMGTEHRHTGLLYMEWAVVILLVVLILIVVLLLIT